jgi:hypothetical protein
VDRLIGLVVALLLVVVALPIVAGYAAGAIPALLSLLVLIGFVRLVWPSRRRS